MQCLNEIHGKIRLQLSRLSACLEDMLTAESVEDEFSHIIDLNSGFMPRQLIRLRQLNHLRWINRLLI